MPFNTSDLERILAALDTDAAPRPELREELHQKMLAEFHRAEQVRKHRSSRRPWVLFRLDHRGWSSLSKWVASVAILLMIAGTVWLIAGGKSAVASDSFASVLRQIQEATSVSYDMRFESGEMSELAHVAIAEPGLLRRETDGGKAWIMDFGRQRGLLLSRTERTACPVTGRDMIPRRELDLLTHLRALSRQDGRFVGRATLDGKAANVFRADVPRQRVTIWTYPETDLPMRVLLVGQSDPKNNKTKWIITLSNFCWNAPMPPGLFSLDPPSGYGVRDLAAENTTEADLVDSLRICATMASGLFPDKFDEPSVTLLTFRDWTKDPRVVRADKLAGSEVGYTVINEPTKEQKAAFRTVMRGLRFAEKQTQNGNEWRYSGAEVRLGDSSRIVCRWKSPGASGHRAVWGDLTVKAMDEDSAESPQTLPRVPPLKGLPTPK